MYRRYDWRIEIISIAFIMGQLLFLQKLGLTTFIICCSIYLLLSIVMYFSLSPKVIFKTSDTLDSQMRKTELDEPCRLNYVRKGVFYSSLVKLFILFLSGQMVLSKILSINNMLFDILITGIFLLLAMYMLLLSMNYFIKANGYIEVDLMDTLNNGILYNNPSDKRSVVNKPIGTGTTINLATKEGRTILWVILAIPITIITLLIVVFSLAG